MTAQGQSRLDAVVNPLIDAHAGLAGIVPLSEGRDAFAVRALLADAAERTLDIQYYIWRGDMSGMLLFGALRLAADRGVRVRLLLDDNNTQGLDGTLAALDAHPNIEIRLFNPFAHRRWRIVDFLRNFGRANRRMHNKSFTADDRVTIVGGRNVGDEYFDAAHDTLFVDFDVMAIGTVVHEVTKDFDRYWTSTSAVPVAKVLPAADESSVAQLCAALSAAERNSESEAYLDALGKQPLVRTMLARTLEFEWVVATMVSDDPAKGLGAVPENKLLSTRLKGLFGDPSRCLDLVSPYFVPGAAGVEYFGSLTRRGISVRILTNSLEATDVAAVHAGYARRRKPLLRAGIALFEMKRGSAPRIVSGRRFGGSGSSSGSSLHAKTFAIDRCRVFVGSFNFDPRSARLNTEAGFVIESGRLAQGIADAFAKDIPARAYSLKLTDGGALEWKGGTAGNAPVLTREPGTTFWRRVSVTAMSYLPFEWLL